MAMLCKAQDSLASMVTIPGCPTDLSAADKGLQGTGGAGVEAADAESVAGEKAATVDGTAVNSNTHRTEWARRAP
eukprot:15038148-Alexandrium_andersonii.AAC.1